MEQFEACRSLGCHIADKAFAQPTPAGPGTVKARDEVSNFGVQD